MQESSGHYGKKILLVALAALVVIIPVAAGEIYCRYFTRINFLDNSRGLFTPDRFGNSYGNTPDFAGISFGMPFRTDADGLRIDPNRPAGSTQSEGAILVMGDSVVFGPALEANETIPGRLQDLIPGRRVLNAGVIGYDTTDYLNATRYYVGRFPEIDTVALFICLNDVNDQSAAEIRGKIGRWNEPAAGTQNPIRAVNDFLRSRSKLYLWFKNSVVDTQKAYFDYDAAFYRRGEDFVSAAMRPVAELSEFLKSRNVKLQVYILPYEYQLRPEAGSESRIPQRAILTALSKSGVEARDLTDVLATSGIAGKELFLYGDPMHLSAAGTRLVANAVCPDLPGCSIR